MDTTTTKKSFSLMLSEPTVAVSARILPGCVSFRHRPPARLYRIEQAVWRLTRVDELLVLHRERLGLLNLLFNIEDLGARQFG